MFWKKKNKRIEEISLYEDGFKINYGKETTAFKWFEINKLTAFKIDRFTVDDICLSIESNTKTVIVSEEYEGWPIFVDKLLIEFPEINENWEEVIAIPAFERNETELYNKLETLGNKS